MSCLGVRLSTLRAVLASAQASIDSPRPTTAEVLSHFVLPATTGARCSFAQQLLATQRETRRTHPRAPPMVGIASMRVSHAWDEPFADLVDALESFLKREPEHAQACFWVDVLSVDFHSSSLHDTSDPTAWALELRRQIAACTHLCVIATPWPTPTFLSRRWCLWETYCALAEGLHVALCPCGDHDALSATQPSVDFLSRLSLVNTIVRQRQTPQPLPPTHGISALRPVSLRCRLPIPPSREPSCWLRTRRQGE